MKVLGWVGVLLLTVACNNAAPTATVYKEQLGAPAPVVGDGNATPGDPAKGQAALAACTGCHVAGGIGRVLAASDAAAITNGDAAKNPAHGGAQSQLAKSINTNAKDIAAFLSGGSGGGAPAGGAAGDATKGAALLKTACESCHNGTVTAALDSFADLTGKDAASFASHPEATRKTITDNKADLEAAIKALP